MAEAKSTVLVNDNPGVRTPVGSLLQFFIIDVRLWMTRLVRGIGLRPIIFSINCYIATILAMFIAFSLDLNPGLAQRIPVRIKLDNVPPDLFLVAGRTATVSIGEIRWW